MVEQSIENPDGAPRRILILTADAGFGHRSAANAVASALAEMYGNMVDVFIANPLEDKRTPFFLRDSQADYDRMVRNTPELYRLGFNASDSSGPAVIMEQALTVLLFEVMRDLIRSFQPDVILSTYPLYQSAVRAVNTLSRRSIPLLVTITDLATVHRLWFNSSVDLCMVPTTIVRDLAFNYGLTPDQVQVTGIPVNPEVVRERRSPFEIRQALKWETDELTVLAIGSRRVDRLLDTINVLNHFGRKLQLILVAGKDEVLLHELKQIDWHVPYKIYNYVHNVPTLMKASDLIVCKAGGLVITEALACGKPLMLVDAIPGQETGNADYVIQNEAGDLARDPVEVLETMSHLLMRDPLTDKLLLEYRTEKAQQLGMPNAAYEVANLTWLAAQRYLEQANMPRGTGRLRLIDLLSRNHVRWEDDSSPARMD